MKLKLQPETSAYYKRILAARGDISLTTLLELDGLIQQSKQEGWREYVIEWLPFCGTNLNAALCKLVTPDSCPDRLINHGFTAAHYSEADGFGVTSGNSSKWLETGLIPGNHGLGRDNICMIVDSPSESVVAGDYSGNTIGDLIEGNAGQPGIRYFHWQNGTACGFPTFLWQTTSRCAKTVAINSGAGGILDVSADGIPLEKWTSSSAGTGGLTGEIGLWKCTRFSATVFENGVLGMVLFCRHMPTELARLANAAVSEFSRKIRGIYGTPEIVHIGDSITACQGATINNLNGFAPRVARALGLCSRNLGSLSAMLSQNTNQIGLVNQIDYLLKLDAQVYTLMGGTNDGQGSVTAEVYGTALNTIAAKFRAANKRLVICSPCYSTNSTYSVTLQRAYAAKCEEAAATYECVYADTNNAIASQTTPTDFMADENHPNDAGHKLMADCIGEALGM